MTKKEIRKEIAKELQLVKPLTKKDKVLAHLLIFGHINSLEAFDKYGVTRLSAIIYELRKENTIFASKVCLKDKFNNYAMFNQYSLEPEDLTAATNATLKILERHNDDFLWKCSECENVSIGHYQCIPRFCPCCGLEIKGVINENN